MLEQTVQLWNLQPPAYSWHSLFFWSAIRGFFFSSGIKVGLCPIPVKYCGFPARCSRGRRVVGFGWHSPERCKGLSSFTWADAVTANYTSITETRGKVGGRRVTRCYTIIGVKYKPNMAAGFVISPSVCHLKNSSVVSLGLIVYCASWTRW